MQFVMASLAAAVEMRKKMLQEQKAEAAKEKKRNVADPAISVDQICKTFDAFMKHSKCDDLWRLVCPPQGVINVTWQSPVNPEWVVKLTGIAFDIFEYAKNTKLLGARVKKALVALHDQRNLTLPQHLGQKDDAMDNIDLKLRIGLNMFRELKQSSTLRSRVFRVLTCDEQTKVQMCLDKIILEDSVEGGGDQCTTSPAALHELPAPQVETPETSLVPVQNEAKQSLRRSLQFSPSSLGKIEELPAIFGKILAGKCSTGIQEKMPAQALTDADILQAAMDFVPSQVDGKKKQSGSNKKKEKKKTASQKKKIQNKKKTASQKKKIQNKKKTAKPDKKKEKPAQSCAAKRVRSSVPKSPDYVIDEMPAMEDGYRNLYVSRHWHRANQLAKRCGLSLEQRKIRRRKAAEEAGKIWDDLHPN